MAGNDFEIAMQGRIIALELFMRDFLTDLACDSEAPLNNANRIKARFLAALQNLDRPVGDYDDRVWGAAADAARLAFDQVIHRISHGQQHGLIPSDKGIDD
jgi:hypothetical protein